jgi:hypothetical protein
MSVVAVVSCKRDLCDFPTFGSPMLTEGDTDSLFSLYEEFP